MTWLLAGSERAALALDDAVRARLVCTSGAGRILEGRRALRNRAISTIEMALATHQLYALFDAWLEPVMQAWELEPLEERWLRWLNAPREISLNRRIYGTLFYEVAAVHDRLLQADPANREMWSKLYTHVLGAAGGNYSFSEKDFQPKVTVTGRTPFFGMVHISFTNS